MINFCIDKIFKLNLCDNEKFEPTGIAFDNNNFYILEKNSTNIFILNKHFQVIKTLNSKRCYSSITYNCKDEHFYVIDNKENMLYKLNENFDEVHYIDLNKITGKFGDIKGLVCCDDGTLLIIFCHYIISIDDCEDFKVLDSTDTSNEYTGLIKCSKCFLCSYKKPEHNIVYGYTKETSETFFSSIAKDFCIIDIVFYCPKNDNEDIIFILAIDKHCKPCIIQCTIKYNCFCLDYCDETNCCNSCEKPDTPNCCSKESSCTLNDLIESVALIETALSHILNAEGEKIQKVVACSKDICDILEVNKSVNSILNTVLHIEHVMVQKLETAKGLIDEKNCSL